MLSIATQFWKLSLKNNCFCSKILYGEQIDYVIVLSRVSIPAIVFPIFSTNKHCWKAVWSAKKEKPASFLKPPPGTSIIRGVTPLTIFTLEVYVAPKGMVFKPFWSENGYSLCLFWSELVYSFRGNIGVQLNVFFVSIPNEWERKSIMRREFEMEF